MASIGSESPPRKKLKQARLPFQVISSPRTESEKVAGGLKRKLSESDDIQITSVVRSSDVDEIKENTIQDGLKSGMKAMLSSLLTSKIINNCTETAEEGDTLKHKSVNSEDSVLKTTVDSEVQIINVEDSEQKSVLSKNTLSKLASWKKLTDSTPSESENTIKDEIIECAEGKTSEPCIKRDTANQVKFNFKNQVPTADSEGSEILSKQQCKTVSPSSAESSELRLREVERSCEDTKVSETAVTASERPEDQNQNSNESGNSSIVEVELEAECFEDDKKNEDMLDDTPTASPKAFDFSSTGSPRTPKGMTGLGKVRLTPKQVARMKEAARKQEEKKQVKLEKERKKQEEQEEKIRLKQEKRKEKEEKEEQRRKEKEEKEKKRQADIEQKHEEKRRKEEQKAEEKRKKDDEKRKAEEEEERKKAKVSAMFTSFFVAKTSKAAEKESPISSQTVQNFMPFEVKSDMRVAPCTRLNLDSSRLEFLDEVLQTGKEYPVADLYLHQLRRGLVKVGRSGRTWLREDLKDEEVTILEPDGEGVFIEQPKMERVRAKFLQFHANYRPAYYGTWRKRSKTISGRRPTAQDKIFDYDVDSADEWEEEEPGESLHGSDDEKDKESEDEYEVDNSVFVPHGYLSDDEGDAEIDEEALNPEMQKAKLKILGEEFETQMKTKTSVLKPIVIILTAALQSAKLPSRYQKLVDRRAVWREDEGPINVSHRIETCDSFGTSPLAQRLDTEGFAYSASRGAKPKEIAEEAIPALITLIHGAPIKGSFLVNEFYEFLKKQSEISEEIPAASTSDGRVWPKLPTASKASIARKLKELAAYEQCNEEGPMKGKRCWIVPPEVRDRYGVANIKLPNRWRFILKRPRAEKTPIVDASPSAEPAFSQVDTLSTSAKKCLITNFTKVMTAEEKKRDWEKMKKSPPVKKSVPVPTKPSGKITAFTSLFPASTSSVPASPAEVQPKTEPPSSAPVKKRVALLVSVPRGQDISSAVEAARTASASVAPNSAAQTKVFNSKKPTEVIELD